MDRKRGGYVLEDRSRKIWRNECDIDMLTQDTRLGTGRATNLGPTNDQLSNNTGDVMGVSITCQPGGFNEFERVLYSADIRIIMYICVCI